MVGAPVLSRYTASKATADVRSSRRGRIYERSVRGSPWMPLRAATHPQRDKAQTRAERIPEIVSARGQHAERIGRQAHADESEDNDRVDRQGEGESSVWRQGNP
jgi:hypothetical protein